MTFLSWIKSSFKDEAEYVLISIRTDRKSKLITRFWLNKMLLNCNPGQSKPELCMYCSSSGKWTNICGTSSYFGWTDHLMCWDPFCCILFWIFFHVCVWMAFMCGSTDRRMCWSCWSLVDDIKWSVSLRGFMKSSWNWLSRVDREQRNNTDLTHPSFSSLFVSVLPSCHIFHVFTLSHSSFPPTPSSSSPLSLSVELPLGEFSSRRILRNEKKFLTRRGTTL